MNLSFQLINICYFLVCINTVNIFACVLWHILVHLYDNDFRRNVNVITRDVSKLNFLTPNLYNYTLFHEVNSVV